MASSKRLREERKFVADEIVRLADLAIAEQRDFNPAELKAWHTANSKYDSMSDEIRKVEAEACVGLYEFRNSYEGQAMPGRGDVMHIPEERMERNASQTDMAIAAWVKNQSGVPVSQDLWDAGQRYGISPNSGGFEVRLENCRARSGRAWLGRHETRAQGVVIGAAGGFTVPEGFVPRLEKAMLDFSGVLQAADIMRTDSGNDLPWPTTDDTSASGHLIGENTAVSEDDVAFGQIVFHAYKLTSDLVRVAAELLQDNAINLAGELGQILGERIGRGINSYCTVGTGASQPFGIVPASTLGVTTASATSIAMDELIQLQHSVNVAYRGPGTAWMMHDLVASYIRRLKDGDGQYLWRDNVQLGQPPLLLGFPVIINNDMASTVTTGLKTVLFGAMNKYKVRFAGGIRLRRLVERYADYDQEGFVAFQRFDGNLLDAGTHPVKYLIQA